MLHRLRVVLSRKHTHRMNLIRSYSSGANNLQKIITENNQVILHTDPNAVKIAADHLRRGNIIALPTDTVYGIACNANNLQAIQTLYEIKGREADKPVAICVSSIDQLQHYGDASHLPTKLLAKLLPGAVTVVLNKSHNLNNPYLNPGIVKIGIRIPNYEFIQNVTAAFDAPIALTSANKSGDKSTLEAYEFNALWHKLGVIIDGGHLGDVDNENKQREASTVVDLSTPGHYEIIRDGIAVKHTVDVLNEFYLKEI